MANHTTRAQRINARHDKLWASMLNPAMPGMSPLGFPTIQQLGEIWNSHEPDRYGWIRVRIGKRVLSTNGTAYTFTNSNRTLLPLSLPRLQQDQKTVAERQWQQRKLAPKPQQPCDHGLFSDDKDQLDLLS